MGFKLTTLHFLNFEAKQLPLHHWANMETFVPATLSLNGFHDLPVLFMAKQKKVPESEGLVSNSVKLNRFRRRKNEIRSPESAIRWLPRNQATSKQDIL